MRTFTLQFDDDTFGQAKALEFESEDAHEAFSLLALEAEQRHVSLYEGGKLLKTITRTGKDAWLLETGSEVHRSNNCFATPDLR